MDFRILSAVALSLAAGTGHAEPVHLSRADLWDLSLEQLMQVEISSVATGTRLPRALAASSVTVISRADIDAMGATDLDEVLESVPGLHVTRSDQVFFGRYVIRGIASAANAEILLMINGIPVKTLFTGTRSPLWAGMPLKSVERIEVIRGPGSALYGADAFAGVINIHTRGAAEIVNNEAGVRAGSFDTWGGWVQQAITTDTLAIGLTAEYEDSNGQQEIIQRDAQSLFDSLTGTNASLAPGRVNTGRQASDLRLDVQAQQWQWRVGYQLRDNIGTAAGIAQALDPWGLYEGERFNTDFTWNAPLPNDDWELQTQLSFYHHHQKVIRDSRLFPPGTNLGGGVFPDGMIGNPSYQEDQARADLRIAYHGWNNHIIRLGAGEFWGDIYKVTEFKNFDGSFAPLPEGLVDVSDTDAAFLKENQRTASHVYLQDEWQISATTALTTGVRFDHYSDFGDTTNPRVALVHEWRSGLSSRISYGRAFHAPTFVDLYASNNPVRLGNPDLQPETIDTWELAVHHQLLSTFNYGLTLYQHRIDDAISVADGQTTNRGGLKGHGGELEFNWQVTDDWRLLGHYGQQQSRNRTTGEDVGEAPEQKAYLRSQWQLAPLWQWTAELLWVGKQPRAAGDARSPLQDYTTLNLSVARNDIAGLFDLRVTARNLLDANVRESSPGPSAPFTTAFVPGDFPMAGRAVMVEASIDW